MIKCDYPDCNNNIREEDKKLKPQTVKFCENHHKQMMDLTDKKDYKKLTSFMMKCAFNIK